MAEKSNDIDLRWDSLVLRLLNAMHPTEDGDPAFMSMSDLSDDQAKRAKAGIMAILGDVGHGGGGIR